MTEDDDNCHHGTIRLLRRPHMLIASAAPDYMAVSYTWSLPVEGLALDDQEVILDGQAPHLTRSLYDVLKQLRPTDGEHMLWVDALCIDQQFPKERSAQVALMGRTFRSARRMLPSLGEKKYVPSDERYGAGTAAATAGEAYHASNDTMAQRPPTTPAAKIMDLDGGDGVCIPLDIYFESTPFASKTPLWLTGITGTGKSSFISAMANSAERVWWLREPYVLHSMPSTGKSIISAGVWKSKDIGPISAHEVVYLVDTPGYDDSQCSDRGVLDEVSSWLISHAEDHGIPHYVLPYNWGYHRDEADGHGRFHPRRHKPLAELEHKDRMDYPDDEAFARRKSLMIDSETADGTHGFFVLPTKTYISQGQGKLCVQKLQHMVIYNHKQQSVTAIPVMATSMPNLRWLPSKTCRKEQAQRLQMARTVSIVTPDVAVPSALRDIRMIPEAEAAAVYTLPAIQPIHLEPCERYLICDAGGGTIDVISYKQVTPAGLSIMDADDTQQSRSWRTENSLSTSDPNGIYRLHRTVQDLVGCEGVSFFHKSHAEARHASVSAQTTVPGRSPNRRPRLILTSATQWEPLATLLAKSIRRLLGKKWWTMLGFISPCFIPMAASESTCDGGTSVDLQHLRGVHVRPDDFPLCYLLTVHQQIFATNDPKTGIYFASALPALLTQLVLVYSLRPSDKYKSRALGTCLITTLLLCAFIAKDMQQVVLWEWIGMNLTLMLSAASHALWADKTEEHASVDEKRPLL